MESISKTVTTIELDVFEDWRLDATTRAKDLVSKMTLMQQAGLVFNMLQDQGFALTKEDALDEDGNVKFAAVFPNVYRMP